jgi:hypothetical protein
MDGTEIKPKKNFALKVREDPLTAEEKSKVEQAACTGRVKCKPNGMVSVKTHLEFTGPDGPPLIPATFFKSKYPPSAKRDPLSEKAREFVQNRNKFRPLAEKSAPGTLDFLKAKVKER